MNDKMIRTNIEPVKPANTQETLRKGNVVPPEPVKIAMPPVQAPKAPISAPPQKRK
jgi:hypothetical protein